MGLIGRKCGGVWQSVEECGQERRAWLSVAQNKSVHTPASWKVLVPDSEVHVSFRAFALGLPDGEILIRGTRGAHFV